MHRAIEPPAPPPPAAGQGMRVSFACPRCGRACWTCWEHLSRGICCPDCGCRFDVGADGALRQRGKVRRTKFVCPRCRQANVLLSSVVARGAECVACNLPLYPGPDDRLHDAEELALVRRQARETARAARPRRAAAQSDRRVRRLRIAVLLVLLAAGVATGLWLARRDPGRDAAEGFTRLCLAGDWQAAEACLPDDDVQRAEFRRWRTLHFASIVDRVRPAGDDVEVAVETLEESPQKRALRVTMTSDFFGRRELRQHWAKTEDRWTFDAAASRAARKDPAGEIAPPADDDSDEPPPLVSTGAAVD